MASGNDGARTRGDDDLIGGQFVAVIGAQRIAAVGLGGPEPRVTGEHLDVRGGAPVVLPAQCDRIDATEYPGDDVAPPHPVDVGVDPVSR